MNNPNESQLTTQDPQAGALAAPSSGDMLSVIKRAAADPTVDMDKMERLLAMAERLQAKDAERAFAQSFAALQSELPQIVATSVIPNRGKYEKYEDIMKVLRPLMVKNGFSVAFSQAADDKRITQTCTVSHVSGHSRVNSFAVRLGGKADSETQADCKASTTAKRNALLNAFDIVVRQDMMQDEDDAGNIGGPISFEQAETLKELIDEIRANGIRFDEPSFLAYVQASKIEDIGSANYDRAFRGLKAKLEAK